MSQPAKRFYEFSHFRLDPSERLLLRNGETVPLPPKIFDLLLLLVQNSGHLLKKEEILSAIWPNTFIEEGNLARYISTLRRVLGESRDGGQYIVTIPRHGYRFAPCVTVIEDGISRVEPSVGTLAVLPFKSLVVECRDESLEMGMAETLITKLSSLGQVVVRSMSAVRKYTHLDQDAVAAGRELKVEAVLDGNIQRAGEKLRVTVRLLNVSDGATLWSGCFDELFTDTFTVQDSISKQIADVLILKLRAEKEPCFAGHKLCPP